MSAGLQCGLGPQSWWEQAYRIEVLAASARKVGELTVCLRMHANSCIRMSAYACMQVCMYVCIYIYKYVCMYVRMYVCIHAYVYHIPSV